ncbi:MULTISPECIES: RodZ domain-containing protein [Marinobacter]|uniref:RodZ domain-containing protein n=1 Tax=Marinobacter TaxID=2742 RepID=UPI001246DEF0|nr:MULTISPECIES: RodZ domain-containing protein [Marinobacter]MBL3557080.1 helix-turn-helix domain-containing protein [Marinobacter sp. JB05H06]
MDSDDTQQPAVSDSVGQQLRHAREQKGLSVSAVADAQHLRPAVIHAIEDGNYRQIDSELFLKGYVRTYARQVDLNPDTVIASLDKELEPLRQEKAQAEELNPLVDIERRRRQKRRMAKLLFFLLVIAIAVFIGLRFLDNTALTQSSEEPDSPEPASEVADPVEAVPESTDASDFGTSIEEDPGVTETAPMDDEPGTDGPATLGEDASVTDEEREVSLVNNSESTEAAGGAAQEPVVPARSRDLDETSVPVVTSSPEPAFEESAQPATAIGSARLEMTFSDECWVQVTDSAGNRLVGALQRDGDRIEVSGRAPIEVIVGAVDAIESIRFDGEPVNMSGFRVVNNRAEFTLDI